MQISVNGNTFLEMDGTKGKNEAGERTKMSNKGQHNRHERRTTTGQKQT